MSEHAALEARIDHALAYPFEPPRESFVFIRGQALALLHWNASHVEDSVFEGEAKARTLLTQAEIEALHRPRHAVIACGSNASPRRLREKFGDDQIVPTLAITLSGYSVVHSAKIAAYGSIPATLHPDPMGKAQVFVNLLDEDQLAIMDVTETLGVAYDRPIFDRDAAKGLPSQAETLMAYVSRHGALSLSGAPVALSMVRQDTLYTSLDQRQAQGLALSLVDHPGDEREFIAENLSDSQIREARSLALKTASDLPFS
ncbi:hypothetical protein [Woodsholea maritima]|uniref:hypothetical protein n=1 Tax=Woodsholea maritima TaxID=240237 RepID=UPI00035E4614|nr:hypothetical protein [Woodsholea maritima]